MPTQSRTALRIAVSSEHVGDTNKAPRLALVASSLSFAARFAHAERVRVVLALFCLAGCGRIRFDDTGEDDGDNWAPTAPPTPFVRLFGSPGFEWAYDVGTFDNGDAVVTFTLGDTIDLGGGPLITNGLAFAAARYRADGTYVWSKSVTSTSTVIARAPNGQIVLAGSYSAAMTIAGTLLNHVGSFDLAYITFDIDGNPLRAWREGDLAKETPFGITVDSKSGDVVIVGIFDGGPTTIGGQSSTANNFDAFVQRFSPL